MKWNSKGHEFDWIGNNFLCVNDIYIWGAGNNGAEIASILLKHNLRISFLDMNEEITKKEINGVECNVQSLKNTLFGEKTNKIILIALKETSKETAVLTAINSGWKLGINLFDSWEFITKYLQIFLLYNKNYLSLGNKEVIALSFNERCTLKCKNCNASIPYISPNEYAYEEVFSDAKMLFSRIDYIEILRVGGAETFLYKDLDKVVKYIHDNFDSQYGCMELTTNGTVNVSKELLQLLYDCRVRVCISDYSNQFPTIKDRHKKLISMLEEIGTMYTYLEDMLWVDFGFNSTDVKAVGDYTIWHDCCAHPCKDYRNGRLYSCSQAYWAQRRYKEFSIEEDSLDILEADKKVIFEYLKGYNSNGYLLPCIICNGHVNLNAKYVPVAEQL